MRTKNASPRPQFNAVCFPTTLVDGMSEEPAVKNTLLVVEDDL
jgi:hypothetical protein